MDCMEILNSWLTTIFGTAAGFLLALYTNRLIAKNSEKKKTIQEKQIKLAHLNYLKSVLEGIVDLIAKQSRHYSDFSDEIKASPYEILEPKIPASFDLLRLRNLDNAVTQEAYFTLFANNLVTVQNYETLFAHGDYMYRVFNSTEKQIYRAAKFKHKDQLEIRDNLLEASTLLGMRMKQLVDTLEINKDIFQILLPKIPNDILKLALSGIETKDDINKIKNICNGALIGTSLCSLPLNQIEGKINEFKSVL